MATRQAEQPDARSAGQDAMLDAAEEVVLRDGIGGLTLDAVARQAKLSKSGLLHHYSSKDALIDALVGRKLANWRADYEGAIDREPPGPGRVPRAFLNMCLSAGGTCTPGMRRSSVVLVAALVHDSARVEPLRAARRDLAARIAADGLPEGVGEAVLLAVDGLWFDWIFGLTELTPQKLTAVRSALLRLLEQAGVEVPGAPPGTPESGSGAMNGGAGSQRNKLATSKQLAGKKRK